jgi:membrane-associated phospholipid phosphatase
VKTSVMRLTLALAVFSIARGASAQTKVSMPRWQGGIAMDATVRAALRAPTVEGRRAADDLSNVLLFTMVAAPYFTAGAYTVGLHGSWRDAAGLALVNSEALGVAFAATFLVKNAVGRERPFATAEGLATYCTSHASDPACGGDRNASFFSGHSAMAFTGAGLLCTQQIFFGSPGMDALGCAGGMIAATATAMLRIVADMHYTTDVLTGAAIGLGAGMLLPYVLHFAPWAPFPIARDMRDRADARRSPLVNFHVTPWGAPGGGGLLVGAQFW